MMSISYAITVCNEFIEIQKLVPFLLEHKRDEELKVLIMILTGTQVTLIKILVNGKIY